MTGTAATPAVMGRAAVTNAAAFLGAVGLAQLVGIRVSGVIDDSSTKYLGTVWGLAFVLAFAFVVMARRTTDAFLAMVYENAGIIYLVAGLIAYLITLFDASDGWPNNGTMTVALAASAAINLSGRGFHIFGAICRWLLMFRPGGPSARLLRSLGRHAQRARVIGLRLHVWVLRHRGGRR
jgi:hypothetical protein